MNVVLIDNYDSFTYNLYHLLCEVGAKVDVFRNDQFSLEKLNRYDKIMLSPGPGIPSESGLLLDVIKEYASKKPILGICLGEQAIGESFGGKLINLSEVFHGIQTSVHITAEDYIFHGLNKDIQVGRYHSWVVDNDTLPGTLEAIAISDEGQVMALRHKEYDVRGIQFHPESVLTPDGKTIIRNWVEH